MIIVFLTIGRGYWFSCHFIGVICIMADLMLSAGCLNSFDSDVLKDDCCLRRNENGEQEGGRASILCLSHCAM